MTVRDSSMLILVPREQTPGHKDIPRTGLRELYIKKNISAARGERSSIWRYATLRPDKQEHSRDVRKLPSTPPEMYPVRLMAPSRRSGCCTEIPRMRCSFSPHQDDAALYSLTIRPAIVYMVES